MLLLLRKNSLLVALQDSLESEAKMKTNEIMRWATESPASESFDKGYVKALGRFSQLLNSVEEHINPKGK